MICNRLNLCDDDGLQHAYDTQKVKARLTSRTRFNQWRANKLDLLPMFSGNESLCELTSKKSTCSTTVSGSYPWNQGSTVPFNGKRPWLVEGVGNAEGSQKRRRVCIKPLLWSAVEHMDSQAVQSLIELKHDCSERYQGWTCLMKAAEGGDEGIVSQLLLQQVDMDAVNNKGRTAMSFAATPSNRAWSSKIGVLRFLLNIGADPSILDDEGYTAESRARKEERWDAVNEFEQQRISYRRSSETRVAVRREDRIPAPTLRSQRSFGRGASGTKTDNIEAVL
jgi:hypothetical protein